MTSSIPNPLPATTFPCLTSLADTATPSLRPSSSYREERTVRCNQLPQSVSQNDPQTLALRYADFILSLTGEDEIVFTLHQATSHPDCSPQTGEADEQWSPAEQTVYATRDQSQKCIIAAVDSPEEQIPTDFALVVGEASSEALKPFTAIISQDSLTVSFAGGLLPAAFEEALIGQLVRSLCPTATLETELPLSVLNHPPRTTPFRGEDGEVLHGSDTLHGEFAKRVKEHPDRPALDFLRTLDSDTQTGGHDIYTYADVDRLSSELAGHILQLTQSATLNCGHLIIPAFLSTSAELYICWLAVLKAECAVCPLPTDAPLQRLQGILEETSATIILGRGPAQDSISSLFTSSAEPPRQWVDVTAFVSDKRNNPSNAPSNATMGLPPVKGEDLAYVMYTSGSTGKPKGVQITHHAAACSISSHLQHAPRLIDGQPPRWFQFAAPTFDPSVMEIFTTLSLGGTLCACERPTSLTDPESAITALSATIMMATPSYAALLRPRRVPTLRHLWTMGETLGRKVIQNFAADSTTDSRDPSDVRHLLNAYGPTEAAVNCTLQAGFSARQRGSIIGAPLATCSMLVLDVTSRHPTPVPLGFGGELSIGGPQVSPGYLGRPEQTAAAFVESEGYGRLYRTGDRARVVVGLDGGLVLDFLGRITTDQVKLSGRRVDLGEIEAVVAEVPGVVECAAVAHQQRLGEKGSEQVVVCVVPREGWTSQTLLEECQEKAESELQAYLRPKRYFVTDVMPRSAAGKVDRKRISAMVSTPQCDGLTELVSSASVSQNPSTMWQGSDTGSEIVRALADISGISIDEITPGGSLPSIGIDSLRAVKFLQHLRALDINNLAISDVLSSETIADLVGLCTGSISSNSQSSQLSRQEAKSAEWTRFVQDYRTKHLRSCLDSLSLDESEIETILPTTSTQAGMLASLLRSRQSVSSGDTAPASYINHSIYEINPDLDVDSVVEAWKKGLSRNELLRTVFVQVDEEVSPFAQCVLSKSSKYALIEVQHSTGDDFEDMAQKAIKDAERSITLERPGFKLTLISTAEKTAIALSLAHSIFDGGSLQLMVQDIEREFHGQEPLPRTSISESTARHFISDRDASAAHWRKELQGNSSEPFPCLLSHKPGEDKDLPAHAIILSDLRIDHLRNKARELSSSPLAVLHASWALILFAYTGFTSDVTFGSVISDRLDDETAQCLAPTFVTVPMRVSLPLVNASSPATVAEVTQRLTRANIDSLSHLHTPLSSVLGADGSLPYDTLFAFQDFPSDNAAEGGMYTKVTYPPMKNDFAVMVEVWPTETGNIELKATYDGKFLDASAAEFMVRQLDAAINFIFDSPGVSFLEGKTRLPVELSSGTPAVWSEMEDEEMLLHRPFERRVAEKPDDLALLFHWNLEDASTVLQMTYQELDRAAEDLAQVLLSKLGVLEDKIVPLCMEKCPELYIAVLGVLKAGGAWCPVDPYSPPARQHDIIKRAEASVVLVARAMSTIGSDAIPEGIETIDITSCWTKAHQKDTAGSSRAPPPPNHKPHNIAYLIFTSGTTGPPKGVPITHAAAAASLKSTSEALLCRATTPDMAAQLPLRYVQFAHFTFDVFVQDLFYTWRCGGALVCATREVTVGSFARLARLSRATHAHLTPSFAATVAPADMGPALRVLAIMGERLPQAVADRWAAAPGVVAYNTYGPAEAAITATVRQFRGPGSGTDVRGSNIGWPLPSVGVYVVEGGRPVMTNAVGELVLAGVQLAKGYWAAPEISAAKMVYNEALGLDVYHTGDMCRQLADGSFDFVGRNDDLVKIAGQRVELSEIAHAVRDSHPLIGQIEVLYPKRPESDDNVLVCFVAAKVLIDDSNSAASVVQDERAAGIATAVRARAESLLPKHMVPTVTLVLTQIPRTPSAKVDRRELVRLLSTVDMQQWDDAYKGGQTTAVSQEESQWAQRNSMLVDAVAEVARVPRGDIKPSTGLAVLGIDSIKAIRLTTKLRSAGHRVSVLDMFKCRNLGEVSALITGADTRINSMPEETKPGSSEDWAASLLNFQQRWYGPACLYLQKTRFKVAPTSTTQEGMLTESMRWPLSYWGVHCYELSPEIEVEKLRSAWSSVVSKTEALRSAFVPAAVLPDAPTDGKITSTFIQVTYDKTDLAWSEKSVQGGELAEVIRSNLASIANQHHADGYSRPPWHIMVVNQDQKRCMVLNFHHSLYDGESLGFLERDVESAYDGLMTGTSRCQLSEAMTRATMGTDDEESASFWKQELQGFDSSEGGRLMASKKPNTSGSIVHRTLEFQLNSSSEDLARISAKVDGLSKTTLLRVAFGLMLSEIMESPDVLFAEIKSDRVLDPRLEDAVAPLVSVIPVPFKSTGSPRRLIKSQHRLAIEGMRNRFVRTSVIRNLTGKSASEPLYPAVFVFHPNSNTDDSAGKKLWSKMDDLVDIAVEHPLALNAFEKGDGTTVLAFSVDESIMSAAQQNVFLRQIDALVSALISHPDEEDVNNLTELFPRGLQSISTPYASEGCPANHMPTLWIERYAREHPEWKAVEVASAISENGAESISWTYSQLEKRSNQIASFILSHGISSQMIGMCLENTLISFAVLAGIMKSGNVYVPIEKDLPQERKMFLLHDSDAPMLLTSGTLFDRTSNHKVKHIIDVEDPTLLHKLDAQPTTPPTNEIDLDGNAYLLYTSGSTGKPKGVLVGRRNLSSFLEGQSRLICGEVPSTPGLAGRGKYLCLASRAFDVHLGETFLAWRHGLCAVTAPRTMLLDDLELALRELHVTHASFVPSLLDQTGLQPADVPELRFLGVGGEKMTPRTQAIWAAPRPGPGSGSGEDVAGHQHHQVSLINAYGPTEATVGCCSGRLYRDSDTQNIGSPLGDCAAHVLVPGSLAHVKRGMPGELCFTGSFVANGYHNRPDARGFVDDFHGEKMYRTGDIVALMPDDTIYFLGRKDDQVKVRGQRLELGEVSEAVRAAAAEAAVSESVRWEHEKVDVQTLLLKHPDFIRQQLVSFVAAAGASKRVKNGDPPLFLEQEFTPCNDALRLVVQRTHPAYMVPDLVIPVSYMPLTQTSAKADTKLLKSLFFSIPAVQLFGGHHGQADSPGADTSSVRELTQQEHAIVEIAQSFASTTPNGLVVRPGTTIFQLGIDSLGAISVYARMKKLGYECSVAAILSGATVEQLAALPTKRHRPSKSEGSSSSSPVLSGTNTPLTDLGESAFLDSSALCGVDATTVATVRPCLPLQEVLIAQSMDGEDEDEVLYVNHITFDLPDDVDVARLVNAWDRVISANEILRTCFRHSDKGVMQMVLRPEALPLSWSQLRSGEVKTLQETLSREIIKSIESHPPLRLTWVSSENALLVSLHHAIYDGESLPMILDDVKAIYLRGTAPSRPPIGPLVDFISHERVKTAENTKSYWTDLLSGWTPAELVTDPTSTATAETRPPTAVNSRTFSRPLSALEQDCARHSLTLPALLQGIFGVCLAQLSPRSHGVATFGAVLSGRTVPVDGVGRMMAPCLATLPQRVNLRGSGTVAEAVAASQRAGFEVLGCLHTATRDVQAWVGADRPLFDAIFSFGRKTKGDSGEEGGGFWRERESRMVLDYALAVEAEADAELGKLVVRAGFTSAFGSSLQADLLLEKMEVLAEAVLRGDKTPVGEYEEPSSPANTSGDGALNDEDWTPVENNIKEIVAAFCKITASGIAKSTSFIHMGIDSVTAIPFARILRERGIKTTASQVIRARCIGTLARQVEEKRAVTGKTEATAEPKKFQGLKVNIDCKPWSEGDEIETVYPCTPLQTGMLSLTLAVDPRLYSHHHAIVLSDKLDIDRLKEAWVIVAGNNDILRTSFHWLSTAELSWVAAVHKQPLIRWDVVQTHNISEALDNIDSQSKYFAHSDFELPPIKTTLVQDGSQTVLVMSMHHVTYDGISVPFLFEDLRRAYLAQPNIERPPFSQAAMSIATGSKSASDFWSRQMQGYQGIEIPLNYTERTVTILTAKTLSIPLDSSNFQLVVPDVALLAFAKALSCLVGTRDVVFGQVVSGRNIPVDGADVILGPMFNTIPFRLRLSQAGASNSDVMEQIRRLSEEAIDFQHASLAEVQKAWRQQAGGVAAANLFDSLFVFQKTPKTANQVVDDPLWTPYEGEAGAQAPAEYAMNFEVEQAESGIFVWAYSKLSSECLASFLDDFKAAFEDIVSQPEGPVLGTPQPLSQIPLELSQPASSISTNKTFDHSATEQYGSTLIQALAKFGNVSPELLTLDSSIFSLGLDSISAITVVSACRRKGVKLSVVDIIQGITIGRICELAHAKATRAETKHSSSESVPTPPLLDDNTKVVALSKLGVDDTDVEDILPVLSGQEYHLAAWLSSGRTMYEASWVFRSDEPIDESRLRDAWARLRSQHAILRSSFVAFSPERAVQVIWTPTAACNDKLNFSVSEAGPQGLEAGTKSTARDIARSPSDLYTPPARLHLVRGGVEGDAVLVTIQHAAYDAWTMVRFIKQLEALYLGKQTHSPAAVPLADFIRTTISDKNTNDLAFWHQHLHGAEPTTMPATHPPHAPDNSKKQTFALVRGSKVDAKSLEAAARRHGATPQSVLVLAFARHLGRATGTAQPTFGMFHLGRSGASGGTGEELYAPTVNVLPFSGPASGGDVAGLLARTQGAMAARVPREQSRLREVVASTGVRFNTGLNILWNDALMVAKDEGAAAPLLRPFDIGVPTDYSSPAAIEGRTAADELDTAWLPAESLFVDVGPNRDTGHVDFGVRCDAVIFDEEQVRRFAEGFEDEISDVVSKLG
ncbi:NRPS protein [Diaporthe australafricana]|uniref:NRPS protein n=1 Tax=Diaporthe australafricana TaxID=127596 RepID=A0ABR3WME2_9PEZI